MTHHRDDCHPVRWVELHPAVTSERTSQNSRRWRKRPGSCWTRNPESQKRSSANSSMTGRMPHPDGLVKPVRQRALTVWLSSCLLTTLLELCLRAGVERFKFCVRGDGCVSRRLSGHTALLPGACCILCLIREHVLGDKDLVSLFTKCSTNHIRMSSRSNYFALQALPRIRPGPRWWWY